MSCIMLSRCLVSQHSIHLQTRKRLRIQTKAWLRPIPHRPAYYEVLSRTAIEQKTVDEWKELTKTDEDLEEKKVMTWKSALTFFHGFVVFHIIPLSFRYTWYRFWKYLRLQYLYPLQKKWALLDAKMDASLSNFAGNGYRFSRAMVSMRLHGKIGPGRELQIGRAHV